MNPQENTKKIPFYIKNFKTFVLLLFIILLVPGYFLFINPERTAYQANKNLFISQESELEQKKSQLSELKKNLMSYEGIDEADLDKVKEILPYGPSEADLYVNISSLVEAAGVKLDNLGIETNAGKEVSANDSTLLKDQKAAMASGQIKAASINLSVSEINYTKVKRIFDLIENNVRLFDIKSFSFSPSEGLLSLTMNSYYLK